MFGKLFFKMSKVLLDRLRDDENQAIIERLNALGTEELQHVYMEAYADALAYFETYLELANPNERIRFRNESYE